MERRSKTLMLALAALTLSLMLMAGQALAVDLDDEGKYQLGGYFKNITGWRLEDGANDPAKPGEHLQKKGDLSIMRNILLLDFGATPNDQLQFKFIGRGYYEAMWDLDSSLYQGPKDDKTRPDRDALRMRDDFEFREYYVTYTPGPLTIKAGKMQVAWGQADALRIADIINPLDLSWYWSFPNWEEIRIPLHMVDMVYAVPNSEHNLAVELIYVPDFRSHQYASPGANWDFLSQIGVPTAIGDAIRDQQSADLPERGTNNFQGGVRVKATVAEWDFALFGYYGRDHLGVNTLDLSGKALNSAMHPAKWHFPYAFNLGGSLAGYCPPIDSVLRAEFAYTFNQPFQKVNYDEVAPGVTWNDYGIGQTTYATKNTFAYMVGFDKNVMLPSLNRNKSFYLSGQFFQKFIFDYSADKKDEMLSFFGGDDHQGMWTVVSLLINTEYYEGKIVPQVLGVQFLDSSSGFFDGRITYKYQTNIEFSLGYLNIWGNENNAGLFFGPVQTDDQVYLMVKYTF